MAARFALAAASTSALVIVTSRSSIAEARATRAPSSSSEEGASRIASRYGAEEPADGEAEAEVGEEVGPASLFSIASRKPRHPSSHPFIDPSSASANLRCAIQFQN